MAWTLLERRTDDTLGKGGALERGQAQVPDFDGASRARDKDVVTFKIAVNNRWSSSMKKLKSFKDLTAPAS